MVLLFIILLVWGLIVCAINLIHSSYDDDKDMTDSFKFECYLLGQKIRRISDHPDLTVILRSEIKSLKKKYRSSVPRAVIRHFVSSMWADFYNKKLSSLKWPSA